MDNTIYSIKSDTILYTMRMYGRRNMHAYVNQIFMNLVNDMKTGIYVYNINTYISELGFIRTIKIEKDIIGGRPRYILIIDNECIPTYTVINGHRAKVRVPKNQYKDNVKLTWEQIPSKSQIKIVNKLLKRYIVLNRLKWLFKEFNMNINIPDLIYKIKQYAIKKYAPNFEHITGYIMWYIWMNGMQDNYNTMQRDSLIEILRQTILGDFIYQRIRTIGYVNHVYVRDGERDFVVDYITDTNEHIIKSIYDFTVKQRRLILDRIVARYIKRYKKVFDKFIKNPAVSLENIANQLKNF